ncbi:MAG: hypothetical protein WCK91_01520 [bacterium]
MWYIFILLYVVGVVVGVFSQLGSIETTLQVLEPITLTALVAYLLVPFAGFSNKEGWQKFSLQYAIVPLFGIYTVVIWRTGSVVGLLLLISASIVHLGYWMSSLHSRGYRLELFRMIPNKPAEVVEQVAKLCLDGRSDEADDIIKEFIRNL